MRQQQQLSDANLKDRLNRTNGAVRFTKFEVRDCNGRERWSYDPGEAIKFRFDYEVFTPISNLSFLFRLLLSGDNLGKGDQIIADICEDISSAPVEPGKRGSLELVLRDLKLRACELSLYVCLIRADNLVAYDVIDANIEMPSLVIRPGNPPARGTNLGMVLVDYQLQKVDLTETLCPT